MSYAVGYLSVLIDAIAILRSLLVNSTFGGRHGSDVPLTDGSDARHDRGYRYILPHDEDQPRARLWYRRIFGYLALFSWVPVILGTIAGIRYPKAETDGSVASLVQSLRCVL